MISLKLNILEKPYDYGIFTTLDAPLLTLEGLVIALLLITLALTLSLKGITLKSLAQDFLKRT